MVCMASRMGRKSAATRSLRAIHTPSGMPMSREMPTDPTMSASVCMLASHRPKSPMKSRHRLVSSASRSPPKRLPTRKVKVTSTGQGSQRRNASARVMARSTAALIGSKK